MPGTWRVPPPGKFWINGFWKRDEQGWSRVYWVTKEDNARARRLYDRFAPADGFIRYSVPVEP